MTLIPFILKNNCMDTQVIHSSLAGLLGRNLYHLEDDQFDINSDGLDVNFVCFILVVLGGQTQGLSPY
jgi:hypothetical protein